LRDDVRFGGCRLGKHEPSDRLSKGSQSGGSTTFAGAAGILDGTACIAEHTRSPSGAVTANGDCAAAPEGSNAS